MNDINNIASIYQQLHLETSNWQMQAEPFDAAKQQQHLFNSFHALHKQMLKSKERINICKQDYYSSLSEGGAAEHYWQIVEEELQEFDAIKEELIALMHMHAFVDAAANHWNHLDDAAKQFMNGEVGDVHQYSKTHLKLKDDNGYDYEP